MKVDDNIIYKGVLLTQIQVVIDTIFSILGVTSQILSIERYCILFFAAIFIVGGINTNRRKSSFMQIILLVWITIIIARGSVYAFSHGFNSIEFKQFISGGFLLYVFPSLMISNLTESFYKRYFKLGYNMSIIGVVLLILFAPRMIGNAGYKTAEILVLLFSGLALPIMTYVYHSKKKVYFLFFVVITSIIIMMLFARRNKVIYYGVMLLFALLISIISYNEFEGKRFRRSIATMSVVLFSLIMICFSSSFSFFWERMATGMESREGIIDLFIEDFNSTPKDWIWGRGMYGSFYGGVLGNDELDGARNGIENGYLQLVLKGGLLWLVPLTLISIKSLYLGLFKSRNLLCKGMALVILLYYIDMIGYGIPVLNMSYINVFVSIAGCNSKWLRNCSDEYLTEEIGLK